MAEEGNGQEEQCEKDTIMRTDEIEKVTQQSMHLLKTVVNSISNPKVSSMHSRILSRLQWTGLFERNINQSENDLNVENGEESGEHVDTGNVFPIFNSKKRPCYSIMVLKERGKSVHSSSGEESEDEWTDGDSDGNSSDGLYGKDKMGATNLKTHMRSHIEDDEKRRPFKCDICGKRYGYPHHLKAHKRTHEEDEEAKKPYKCDICGKRLTNARSLAMHRTKDDPNKIQFKCEICGNYFTEQGSLKKHLKIHELDMESRRTFPCDICGKLFTQAGPLYAHRKLHASSEKERRPFECDICGKSFTGKNHLSGHKLSIHRIAEARFEKFKCDLCGKLFTHNMALNYHKDNQVCTLEKPFKHRPFKCDVCGQGSTTKRAMQVHKLTHGIIDPVLEQFKCKICGKAFPNRFYFNLHMPKHQGSEATSHTVDEKEIISASESKAD